MVSKIVIVASLAIFVCLLVVSEAGPTSTADERLAARQNRKPGTCPVRGVGTCNPNNCKHDGECKGQEKCCETACGGRYCTLLRGTTTAAPVEETTTRKPKRQ